MKRHLVFPADFDSRAHLLEEPGEQWDEQPRKLHLESRESLLKVLAHELGPMGFNEKVDNFRDAGLAPFSVIAHHNLLFREVRYSFIHGFYYPSLVAACALGERILNHLILDLRENFRSSPHYKDVYRKQSFDDWEFAIRVLQDWNVFQVADIASDFKALGKARNQAVHFNTSTVLNLRAEALIALRCVAEIIGKQFGFAGRQRWLLPGTRGSFFIKKECEADPFLRKYYLPQCPYVGPYYAMTFTDCGWVVLDRERYEDEELSDSEFARRFESRTPEMLVSANVPPEPGVSVVFPPEAQTLQAS